MKKTKLLSLAAATVLLPAISPALYAQQILFIDGFETDTSSSWNVNASPGTHAATFSFDYSTVGIPPAPGVATTRGLKLEANYEGGVFGGLSVSPMAVSLPDEYVLRFHLWQNFNGPAPLGGNGSTQVSGAGVGTAGTSAQWAGGTHDSVHFGATGEGGSAQDYRVYPVAAIAAAESGFYAAGTASDSRNSSNPYYSVFGNQTPPSAQTELFPSQTGATAAGTLGFAWRQHVITKTSEVITWDVDGTRIVTLPTAGLTLGGNNFLLNHFDINANSSTDPNARNLLFGLYDNVVVYAVPEPSAMALFGVGAAAFAVRRRKK